MGKEKTCVLVVDDEHNLRKSLVELVEGEGLAALEAGNGEAALSLLREAGAAPDVILLDLRMPKLDGLSLLRLIREEKLTDAPVVIVSAWGDSAQTIEAMRLGAYDYI